MASIRYNKSHEYIKQDVSTFHLGISNHAQGELGDITFVELPEVGTQFAAGDVCCTVESVKAVAEIYAPVGFKVVAVNEALEETPELINESSEGNGWLISIEPDNPDDLLSMMDADAYAALEK